MKPLFILLLIVVTSSPAFAGPFGWTIPCLATDGICAPNPQPKPPKRELKMKEGKLELENQKIDTLKSETSERFE